MLRRGCVLVSSIRPVVSQGRVCGIRHTGGAVICHVSCGAGILAGKPRAVIKIVVPIVELVAVLIKVAGDVRIVRSTIRLPRRWHLPWLTRLFCIGRGGAEESDSKDSP